MDKAVIIALLQSFVEEALHQHAVDNPPLRGPRGQRGRAGTDFDIDIHRETIREDIKSLIVDQADTLSLKFKDLSDEEIAAIRGPRGRDGKAGRGFSFEAHREEIVDILAEAVASQYDNLRLKFSDLTVADRAELRLSFDKLSAAEIRSIRGPRGARGQRGIAGTDFIYTEHQKEIEAYLYANRLKFSDLSQDEVESLKLKFSDLSQEDRDSLVGQRGPRGERGPRGLGFEYENHREEIENYLFENRLKFSDLSEEDISGLKLKFSDLTDNEIQAITGPRGHKGPKGERGVDGLRGEKGSDGEVGPKGQRGLRGEKGAQGVDGVAGERGEPGEQGLKGPRGQRGKVGATGEQGPVGATGSIGPMGPMGPMGVMGLRGEKGLNGEMGLDGRDGVDAPRILDIKPIQYNTKEFKLLFIFEDGSRIETQAIRLPKGQSGFLSIGGTGSGGGGLSSIEILQDGLLIGQAKKLDFKSGFKLEQKGDTVEIVNDPTIKVLQDGASISAAVKNLDFRGDGVVVRAQTTMGDWVTLDSVAQLSENYIDPNTVIIEINKTTTVESANYLVVRRLLSETVIKHRCVTAVDGTHVKTASSDSRVTATVLGVALQGGVAGDYVDILLLGNLTDAPYPYTLNANLYLLHDGTLGLTHPMSGFVTQVCECNGLDSFMVRPQSPMEIL